VTTEKIAYQGAEKIPPGERMTIPRLRRMMGAVDASTLTKKHKAVVKAGILKYADGDGLFFCDQREWALEAGRDVKVVTAAIRAAYNADLLNKSSRVYTTNGRMGTSLYWLNPRLWSSRPNDVKASVDLRLDALTFKPKDEPYRAPKTVDGPCTENGAAEQDVLLRSSPPSTEEMKVVFDDEGLGLDEDEELPTGSPVYHPPVKDALELAGPTTNAGLVTKGSSPSAQLATSFERYLAEVHMPDGTSFPRMVETVQEEFRYQRQGAVICRPRAAERYPRGLVYERMVVAAEG
jgi:hypothetical protein